MSTMHRVSLFIIAISLMLLSPISIWELAWDHANTMALKEIYAGVFRWSMIFLAGAAIVVAIFAEDSRNPPKL